MLDINGIQFGDMKINSDIIKSTCIDKVCPVITEEVSEVDEGGLQMMANC